MSTELVGYTPLPAETGPTLAPDALMLWPVEGDRYGLDVGYHGTTGTQRATAMLAVVQRRGLAAQIFQDQPNGGSSLRMGPLTHDAAWLAIEAFIGPRRHLP